jgi:AbrB family looped-hinge helix DNA binding protein
MKVTSKGRVTIPQEIRERLGLLPGIEVDFVVKGNVVEIVKSRRTQSRMAKHLRRVLGSATTRMSTDEIMKLTRG